MNDIDRLEELHAFSGRERNVSCSSRDLLAFRPPFTLVGVALIPGVLILHRQRVVGLPRRTNFHNAD